MNVKHFKQLLVGTAVALASVASSAAIVGQLASATITGNGGNQFLGTLTSAQTQDLYISFDINFVAGTISSNDFVGLWLDNGVTSGNHTTVPNMGLKADLGAPSNTADYFVRTTGLDGNFDVPPPNATVNQSVSMFVHLWKSAAGDNYNRMSLWIDEDLSNLPALLATTPDAQATGNSTVKTISNFGFRAATLTAGDQIQISNLVIRNSVPEPASAALALVALLGMAAVHRRRAS